MSEPPRPLAKASPKLRTPARKTPRPGRSLKLRLVDGVALAAGGLLLLKLTALLAGAPPEPGAPLPDFARVLAKARTGYELPDPTTTGSVTPKAETAKADAKPTQPEPVTYQPATAEPVSPSERAILEKLAARRETLKQRSDALDLREQMLGAAEKKLETGLGDLRGSEEKSDLGGAKKAEAEKAGLKSIVTMYETMKPKDAARVFDRLGHEVLVPIVLGMNPRKMAEILALMGSEPAEKLTVALANRARGQDVAQTASAVPGLPPGELPAFEPGPPTRP